MTQIVVIAARGGAAAKSRLAGSLSSAARQSLVEAMLTAMLETLRGARIPTLVVSPTPILRQLAHAYGVKSVADAQAGLNEAFRLGALTAFGDPSVEAVALLPGDIPGLDPIDVRAAFRLCRVRGGAIARSRSGDGTGLLAWRRGAKLGPSFEAGSFLRHKDIAHTAGVDLVELNAPSLSQDVDTADDLRAILPRIQRAAPAALAQRFAVIGAQLQTEMA